MRVNLSMASGHSRRIRREIGALPVPYSASKVDDAADALADAVERMKKFMREPAMKGETDYERATINLWKKLAAYRRARNA